MSSSNFVLCPVSLPDTKKRSPCRRLSVSSNGPTVDGLTLAEDEVGMTQATVFCVKELHRNLLRIVQAHKLTLNKRIARHS